MLKMYASIWIPSFYSQYLGSTELPKSFYSILNYDPKIKAKQIKFVYCENMSAKKPAIKNTEICFGTL